MAQSETEEKAPQDGRNLCQSEHKDPENTVKVVVKKRQLLCRQKSKISIIKVEAEIRFQDGCQYKQWMGSEKFRDLEKANKTTVGIDISARGII